VIAVALAAGCAAPPPRPAPPPPPPLHEQPLAETTTADFLVSPTLDQTVSADGQQLFVEGMIRNRGSRASRDLRVFVEALDAQGNVLYKDDTLPTPQAIPPGEGTRFLVRFPNDAAIQSFHVEVVGH